MRAILTHRVAGSHHRSPAEGNSLLGGGTTRDLAPTPPLPRAFTSSPGDPGEGSRAVLAKWVATYSRPPRPVGAVVTSAATFAAEPFEDDVVHLRRVGRLRRPDPPSEPAANLTGVRGAS